MSRKRITKTLKRYLPIAAAWFFSNSSHAINYEFIDLGVSGKEAYSLNDSGHTTGLKYTSTGFSAYYDDTTSIQLLVPDGVSNSDWGNSINNSNQVVGFYSPTGGSNSRGFLYDNGIFTDIGNLGSTFDLSVDANAGDINDHGQIVGYSGISGSPTSISHAFLYQNGTMQDLGTLGGDRSSAQGINENGVVVGTSTNANGEERAFIYENGIMTDLGLPNLFDQVAMDINNNDQVLGYYIDGNGTWISYIHENGAMKELGTLFGENAFGNSINNSGQIVGNSGFTSFLYDNGNMYDLCALVDCATDGMQFFDASDINDNGDIVGSVLLNGDMHTYMLKAVPVPAAVYLFASGFVFLFTFAKYEKKAP